MAAIAEAVKRMERAGYRLDVDGGKLVVSGEKPLTPAQQSWLRQHKPELLDYLAADVVDVNTTPALPPPPSYATRIRCLDCRYSDALPGDELGAWRLCHAGRGGWFGLQRHDCDAYTASQRTPDAA